MRFMLSAVVALSCGLSAPAFADDFDRNEIRGEIYCFPMKYAVDLIEKLANAEADKKDIVDSVLAPRFRIFDGGELPGSYFIRPKGAAGEMGTPLTIMPDGGVPDFLEKIKAADKDSDLCIKDRARAGRPGDDEGLYFEMGLMPKFINRGGSYSYAELKEGTKDGKFLYKKMIPAVARLFMPDTNHLSLRYDDLDAPVQITAFKGDEVLPAIDTIYYDDAYVFDLDDLKDMDADRLVIKGGAYELSPVPSVKTMKRFGIGEKNVDMSGEVGD